MQPSHVTLPGLLPSIRQYRTKLTTRCDDRRAIAKFLKSRVWDKVPEGTTPYFGRYSHLRKCSVEQVEGSPKPASLCSASYVRWERGTTRIRPPHTALLFAVHAAINRYLIPTAVGLLLWAHAGTDRQTDRRTLGRCIDPLRIVCGQCRNLPARFVQPTCDKQTHRHWATANKYCAYIVSRG